MSATEPVGSESVAAQPSLSATVSSSFETPEEMQKPADKSDVSLLTAPGALDQKKPACGLRDSMWATPEATSKMPVRVAGVSNGFTGPNATMPGAFDKHNVRVCMKQGSDMPFGRPRPGAVHLVKSSQQTAALRIIQEGQLRVDELLAKGALLYIEQGKLLIYKPAVSKAYWRMEFPVSHMASNFRNDCMRFLELGQEELHTTLQAVQAVAGSSNAVKTEQSSSSHKADDIIPNDTVDTTMSTISPDGTCVPPSFAKLVSLSDDEEAAGPSWYVSAETRDDLEGLDEPAQLSVLFNDEAATRMYDVINQRFSGGFAAHLDGLIKEFDLDPEQAMRLFEPLSSSMFAPKKRTPFAPEADNEKVKHVATKKMINSLFEESPNFGQLGPRSKEVFLDEASRRVRAIHQAKSQVNQLKATDLPEARATASTQGLMKYTADELKLLRQNAIVFPERLLSDGTLKNERPMRQDAKVRPSLMTQKSLGKLSSPKHDSSEDRGVPQNPVAAALGEPESFKEADVEKMALKVKEATATPSQVRPISPKTRPSVRATDILHQSKVLRAMSSTKPKPRTSAHRFVSSSTETSTSVGDGHEESITSSVTVKPAVTSPVNDSETFRRHRPMGSDLHRLSKSFEDMSLASDSESSAQVMKFNNPSTTAVTAAAEPVAQTLSARQLDLANTMLEANNRNLKGLPGLKASMWATPDKSTKPSQSVKVQRENLRSSSSTGSPSLNPSAAAWSASNAAEANQPASYGMSPLISDHIEQRSWQLTQRGCSLAGSILYADFKPTQSFPSRQTTSPDRSSKARTQYSQDGSFSPVSTRKALSPSKKENVEPARHGRQVSTSSKSK